MKPCTHTTTPHLDGGLYRLSDTCLSSRCGVVGISVPGNFISVFTFNTL